MEVEKSSDAEKIILYYSVFTMLKNYTPDRLGKYYTFKSRLCMMLGKAYFIKDRAYVLIETSLS